MNLTAYEEHAIRELLRPLRDIDTDQSATSANATEPPRPHRRRLLLAEVGVVLATLLVITGLVVLARGHHASAPATNPHHHRAPNLPKHQLLAPNAVPGDTFGQSVAMFGRTALVGAPTTDHGRGVVYVYTRRTSGTWRLRQTITARDSKRGDYFGMSVAISGSTIFVGATHRSHDEGAAYVFVRSGGHWVQAQELGANHATTDQLFGNAVAVGPGYAVVCGMGGPAPPRPGYCSAYQQTSSGWVHTQTLQTLSDKKPGVQFGSCVALGGDQLIIGSPGEHHLNGAAYLYIRRGGKWHPEQYLTVPLSGTDNEFGSSVAVNNTRALVGTWFENVGPAQSAGAAYIFERTSNGWKLQQRIVEAHPRINDQLGTAVAFSGGEAVIGAPGRYHFKGAAYVYAESGGHWILRNKLTAPTLQREYLGASLATTAKIILTPAYGPKNPGHGGKAYAYTR